jgi:hypothetical protein
MANYFCVFLNNIINIQWLATIPDGKLPTNQKIEG